MSQIPQKIKLLTEDFPDQPWIEPLIRNLNQFMDEMVDAVDRKLTINDNFAGKLIEVELDGQFPKKLAWDLADKPKSVLVGNARRSDGTAFTLTDAIQVQWQYNAGGQLQIDRVVGISPSAATKYKLMLEIKVG